MRKSTKKIEQGLYDLIQETKASNESLISRALFLDKLQTLIKTLLLHTRRRLSNKLNSNPQTTVDRAFKKFNEELKSWGGIPK